ncbi:MAG: ATP-binding domain-containing protein [Propionivibrio sp.]|uniref:ATP-binding domain-containing protein n=1 Tax=Propionivibrio sp. TaxID=2212460 RepID=UPI001A5E3386|nr:ATP-binding domain-containing protein [Propionivibrio sp.]MBL8416169.1 ATP-binding domain-containing protein [Propionivibrio sp.]
MARIIPEGWREMSALGAVQREIETLEVLAAGLPDDYTVYHGVHWTRIQQGCALVGEIDFAIVSPAGKLLLIEQKSGFLSETPEGLVKIYAAREKSVAFQMRRTSEALHSRLRNFCPEAGFVVDALLYCPDYIVKQPGSAGIDPERIVDAPRRDRLVHIVQSILPADEPVNKRIDRLHRFLGDQLKLVPEVNALVGQAKTLYTRLSGGLSQWARQIECEPFRLRVIGTAGSGKTQLALAVFRDALAAGRRPLYVCYNRPLADHVALIAPSAGEVATYHQLADRICRDAGHTPDFTQPSAFARLESFLDDYLPTERWLFDEVIIDEGQDFQASWKDNLLKLLRAPGRAWWLEDPMQNLYARTPVELPGWVVIRSETNYRSPQDILGKLNRLLPNGQGVEAGSPLNGSEVDIVTYADPADLFTQTKRAITQCIAAGFKRDMIALVTYRGRENSLLTPYDRLGSYPLRTFTGCYDLFGNPVFSEGDVPMDSVYRFKGQAAPCIIFTEIDFATLDDLALRKLFVGVTRATMKLTMIVSQRAALKLIERLDDPEAKNC